MIDHPDRSWEFYGRHDPYFGVLTQPEFRSHQMDEEARRRFFRSGEEHLAQVLSTVRAHLDPEFDPQRGLDFGCGVGRILLPMAGVCRRVVGVDVSQGMLEEAQDNVSSRKLTNVALVRSDDALSQIEGQFDFIHSTIVFQHIPRRRGERLLRLLLDRLTEGGIGAMHFTYARTGPGIRLIDWARRALPLVNGFVNVLILRLPFRFPLVQMNVYDLGSLFHILHDAGCRPIVATPTTHVFGERVTTHGVMLHFRKAVDSPHNGDAQ